MTFRDVHEAFGVVTVVLNAIAGTWVLLAHYADRARHRAMWWTTAIAYGAVFLQVVLGVVLLQRIETEPSQFHIVYGFLMLLSVGIIYSYRQQMEHKLYLLFGYGSLFIAGLGVRAMFLAT